MKFKIVIEENKHTHTHLREDKNPILWDLGLCLSSSSDSYSVECIEYNFQNINEVCDK